MLVLIYPAWTTASNAVYDEVSALGKMISNKIPKGSKIAVTELVDLEGNVSSLGKFIAEELITDLTINGKEITVIERRLMMKVLNEQKMSVSELVEPNAIKNIGKLLGASAIITGTITELGDEVRVNARVISTKTGEIMSVARTTLPVTGVVKKLIDQHSNTSSSATKNSYRSNNKNQKNLVLTNNSIEFNDLLFVSELETVELKKLEILDDSKIKVDLKFKNTNEEKLVMDVKLINPSNDIYLVDDLGNEYRFIKSNLFSENTVTVIRPGVIKNVFFLFESISPKASTLSLYFNYWRQRRGRSSSEERAVFDSIPLK